MNFKNLNLINPIIRAVTEAGYSKPTEIQSNVIPQILMGRDVMGCAQTGTGKTGAFVMPVLQLLKKSAPEHKEIRTLILTPTRALATEVEENFKIYTKYLPLSLFTVYDGVSQGGQLAALRKRVDVLIATPERLLDLVAQRHINLSKIEILILDEADKMPNASFIDQVKKVLKLIPQKRQTLFFSSTMPKDLRRFADSLLNNPVEIMITQDSSIAKNVDPSISLVEKKEKTDLLVNLLQDDSLLRSLHFAMKRTVRI
ncbi:DEAD/DEAH box helicase [Chryseobacterium piperi]|uniref:DEAD/DEAH box helicase n=1 Tax=Chryseobacterium piperi TaxID=558152 RepID=UPI00068E051A|nr:DEAD/DEAH box helicase [Chryseobacterium piperi]ASW74325.1 DEAD/DEAH box helicase [Chryseobacterium piperi]